MSGKQRKLNDNVVFNPKQQAAAKLLSDITKKFFLFYGGSRSGKTFLVCYFIRHRARKYSGSKHLVARYSFANAHKTIWMQTLYPLLREDEQAGLCSINQQSGICRYYNGSIIILGGLEPSRIDSVLASEYATIFVTEANENKFNHIEMLFSRLNDTAKDDSGREINVRFIADLNPTTKNNWTFVLFITGLDPITNLPRDNYHEFVFLHFKPEDNIQNLSNGYIDSLKSLSPSMRKRFYEGQFGSFEGLVYNLDESVHLVDDFAIPSDWEHGCAIDFGYTHNFVSLYGAYDKANDCLYVYMEYSAQRRTVRQHAENMLELVNETRIDWTVADHDAEDRATLEENGITTDPANKEVLAGIDNVIDKLHHDKNKKTNIKIFRSCSKLIFGLYCYRWKDPTTTNSRPKDREVVKEDDDHVDAFRYLVMRFFPGNIIPGVVLNKTGKEKLRTSKLPEKPSSMEELARKEITPGIIRKRG